MKKRKKRLDTLGIWELMGTSHTLDLYLKVKVRMLCLCLIKLVLLPLAPLVDTMFSENENLDFDYITWPTNTGNKMEPAAIAIAYMSVSKDSKNAEEAMKFMSFYTSAEGQKSRLAGNGNAVPSVNGVDELITEDAVPEHASYLIDAREIGIVDDKQVMIPGLDKEIGDIMDLMYLGKQDADKTMADISKKAKEMIEAHRKK